MNTVPAPARQKFNWQIRQIASEITAIVTCKYQSHLLSNCASITARVRCFTMFRLRRRTTAFAAVLLAPGLLLPAAAQQVQRVAAAGGPDYSRCDRLRESDPLGASRCRVEVLNGHTAAVEAHTAAVEARGAAADRAMACMRAGVKRDMDAEARASVISGCKVAAGLAASPQ